MRNTVNSPHCEPLLDFPEKVAVVLVDGVEVAEDEVGQVVGHHVLFAHQIP